MGSRIPKQSGRVALLISMALMLGAGQSCRGAEPSQQGPNIILISVDTLRADHLGCYGYPLDTSPNLDKFAENALLYSESYAHSSETRPSLSTIMSGFYPHETKVASNFNALPDGVKTLPEYLGEAGYYTGAVVGSIALTRSSNFNQGFDTYADIYRGFDLDPTAERNHVVFERNATEATRVALEWLEKNKEKKFFLWLHYQDPHGPYLPSPPFNQRFINEHAADQENIEIGADEGGHGVIPRYQKLGDNTAVGYYRSQYDGEIAFLDDRFGKLMAGMESLGLLESSLIVFTADHGESLGEHNYYFAHGVYLYRELIQVPLIIFWKGMKGVVKESVQHVDILPTILGVLGMDGVKGRGRNILEPPFPAQGIYSEIWMLQSITDGNLSLTRNTQTGEVSLFDISRDPGQLADLANEEAFREKRDALLSRLEVLSNEDRLGVESSDIELNSEEKDMLKALGYVE